MTHQEATLLQRRQVDGMLQLRAKANARRAKKLTKRINRLGWAGVEQFHQRQRAMPLVRRKLNELRRLKRRIDLARDPVEKARLMKSLGKRVEASNQQVNS